MKKLKHSKYKNTGILFELLIRQIATDTLNNKNSTATKIVKEHFGKKTELAKELKLYQTIVSEKFNTEYKANEFLTIVLKERAKLNNSTLNRQKYNLIKEIKSTFVLEDFFKYRVSNYKENASIFKLFEYSDSDNPKEHIECKSTLLESLSGQATVSNSSVQINEEYSKQPREIRLLAWKMLVDSFNSKYTTLSKNQKGILKEYINSVDNSEKLREFVTSECDMMKRDLKSFKITDKVTRIKVNEVIKMLSTVKSAKVITESQILSLLRYSDLKDELKKVF